MEQNGIPATSTIIKKAVGNTDSFKQIALGGPGMAALAQLPDLRLRFVNKQFEHYLGYSNDDLEQEAICFSDMLDHYQMDRLLYQLQNVKENTEAQSRYVVYRLKDKKGTVSDFYLYAAPAASPDGDLQDNDLYHFVLHPNLSKWEIPFTSFVTRELFLEHFNSEDFGTFEWIMNIDKVFMSEGLYHIYEIANTEMEINRALMQSFIHPADVARFSAELEHSIATGHDLDTEFKVITANQNVKIVHCLGRPVKDKEGAPIKYAGSIRDITSQRHIEEDLKNKVTELYHSNKELEEFAYVASHDMQEPLRKITIFSDRLSEKYKDVLTGDGSMYLTRMIAAAENMRKLIDGLLEFSRITKAKQPFEQVNLNSILRQVETDLELVIEETNTTITSAQLPTVEAVGSQMKQLFANIIGNAIKFHKPGVPPAITIESKQMLPSEVLTIDLPKNTDYYKITITDNGVGFEEEYATRIFQMFQRLHGKSEYPGSGIGLAICKKIMEYHRGNIYAENIPEVGARFTFILPQRQTPKESVS